LHCWFLATRRSLKVREGYFALLIPSKWEFSKEYVQTIKRLLHFPPKVITSLCYVAARLKFYVNTIWSQLCNPSYGLRQRLTSFFLLRLLHLLIYLVCQVLHHWCQRTLYWIHLFLHQNHLATFANKICNHFTLFALWPWLTHISTISNKTATFKPKLVLRITV